MVRQTRIIFDLSEVVAVRLQCGRCGDEVVQSVRRTESAPTVCPMCECPWGTSATQHVLRTIRKLLEEESAPVVLRFELPGDVLQDSKPA